MYKQNKQLLALIEPVVSAMGYELLGVEHLKQGKHSLLRLYIDNEDGINLSDCEAVSHQVTGVLDVEDPVQGGYNLEVSSPGLDRPLFTLAQFARHRGEEARLTLGTKVAGRRKLQGQIMETVDNCISMMCEGIEYRVPADAIQQARIVPGGIDQYLGKKREN